MEVYDINSGQWSTGPSKPTPCSWARAAVWHDKIYVFGGVGQGYFNVGEVFDPATNTWSSCASFSGGRYLQATVTANDKIYIIGGDRWEPRHKYDDIQEYDPLTDSWCMKTPMSTPATHLNAVAVNNKIWIFGSNVLCRVYDIAADHWEEKTSNQNPTKAFSVAYLNGVVYRFGGGGWGPNLDVVEAAVITP
jgi:N-acetylneuraminic acid mutarotase